MGKEIIRIVDYKDIGRVSFIRKDNARNLKIVIKPLKGIQVTLPRSVSLEKAGQFVDEKRQWIRKSQMRLNTFEAKRTVFTGNEHFQTRDYVLVLNRHDRPTIKTVIGKGQIFVSFPVFAEITDPRVQNAIRKALLQAWRIEAKKYLPQRTEELAKAYNLQYSRITVRDNKTRWGSCTRDDKISLNIHLMRLPQRLSDYIILHELAHTVHRNHQKSFWTFLDQLTGGRAKQLDREMNKYNPEIW